MRAVIISKVAAFCSASTFLIASPLQADSRLIHVTINDTAATALGTSALVPAEAIVSAAPADAVPNVQSPAIYRPVGGGMASYYSNRFAGARTASGERYDPAALTAAHRSLPFGSQVQVTNAATGQSVIVTINDRGPFHGKRVIDVSRKAARELGIERAGSGKVTLALLAN